MANKYFGNVGDVFKHLLLADILACELPGEYWESHAGNARYAWVDSPARRHGINRFFRALDGETAEGGVLAGSHYGQLLKQINPAGLREVPGSPLLAMRLLPETARFMFCDTDDESLLEVQATAREAGIAPERLELLPDDGLSILHALAIQLPPVRTRQVLAFIDPYDATALTASLISPLTLFGELAGRGIKTVLWYGYKSSFERTLVGTGIQDVARKYQLHPGSLWHLHMGCPGVAEAIGLSGAGLVAANLQAGCVERAMKLMNAFEAVYREANPVVTVTREA